VIVESTSSRINQQFERENNKIISCRINAVKGGKVTFLKPNMTTSQIKKGNTDSVLFSKPSYITGKFLTLTLNSAE
jgi:hypothetical protein